MRAILVGLALLAARPALAQCDWMGGSPRQSIQLLFGRSMPGGGAVSDTDWAGFLAETVTPRFPDGLTVLNGNGQWLSPAGRLSHEPSTVVLIIAPMAPDLRARLDAVRQAYRVRFHQQSVGLVTSPVCAAF
jgi:hypothetical protein